ncbi:hypothetical protein ACP2W0_06300 [Pseudobacillus badius]|uniref:hypothetical protein n=1 Tax=Bacillus badius TaxID=1455 RepID=UPI003CFA3BE3
MKIVNAELQYDESKMDGDFAERLQKILSKEGIEVVSVDKNTNTEPESPYQKVKNTQADDDISSAGAGGMVSPN